NSRWARGRRTDRISGQAAASASLLLSCTRLCASTARLRGADTVVLLHAGRARMGQFQRYVGASARPSVRLVLAIGSNIIRPTIVTAAARKGRPLMDTRAGRRRLALRFCWYETIAVERTIAPARNRFVGRDLCAWS